MSTQGGQIWVYVGALLLVCSSALALEAQPPSIVFQSLDDVAMVAVMDAGNPVTIQSVKGHELYVQTHTYGYMISVEAADGKLRIKPKELEAGSYLLVVQTNAGEVRVNVYAPLEELPNTIEKQAAVLGISPEKLKEQLGMATVLSERGLQITLPAVQYVGQTMTLELPEAQHTMTWAINGTVVAQGVNEHTLNYTFPKPGVYVLTYVESRDGAIVASATATTKVLPMPDVVTTIRPNTDLILNGPEGYNDYTWTLDGVPAGEGATWTHRFLKTGQYTVENMATSPLSGNGSFQKTRYVVRVES